MSKTKKNQSRKEDNDLLEQMALEGSGSQEEVKSESQSVDTLSGLISGLEPKQKVKSDPFTVRVPRHVYEYYEKLARSKEVSMSKVGGEILTKIAESQMQVNQSG